MPIPAQTVMEGKPTDHCVCQLARAPPNISWKPRQASLCLIGYTHRPKGHLMFVAPRQIILFTKELPHKYAHNHLSVRQHHWPLAGPPVNSLTAWDDAVLYCTISHARDADAVNQKDQACETIILFIPQVPGGGARACDYEASNTLVGQYIRLSVSGNTHTS